MIDEERVNTTRVRLKLSRSHASLSCQVNLASHEEASARLEGFSGGLYTRMTGSGSR